jgi:hypothetical protein
LITHSTLRAGCTAGGADAFSTAGGGAGRSTAAGRELDTAAQFRRSSSVITGLITHSTLRGG